MRARPWWKIFAIVGLLLALGAWGVWPSYQHPASRGPHAIGPAYPGVGSAILLIAVVIGARVGWPIYRRSARRARRGPTARDVQEDVIGGRAWFFAGALAVAGTLAGLEWSCPYYFLQHDNQLAWQPVVVHGMDELVRGEFPDWNPAQGGGVPDAGLGTASYFYPPTWVAYAVSRWGVRNEDAFTDVFCILHLLVAYVLMERAGRQLGIGERLAAAGAVCFSLSGYALIAGRSWGPVVMGPMLCGPLLLLCLIHLKQRGAGFKWAMASGGTLGVLYLAGFPQNFVYALICFGAAVLLLAIGGGLKPRAVYWATVAVMIGVAIALPLFIVQHALAGDIRHGVPIDAGIERGLLSMILPVPLAHAHDPAALATVNEELAGQFYYSGTVFTIVGWLAFGSLIAFRRSRVTFRENIWIPTAAVAFLIALGEPGLLWKGMLHLPLVQQASNYPFRMLPFVHVFLIPGAALIVRLLLARVRRKNAERGLAIAAMALAVYGAAMSRTSFYSYGFTAYPPLPAEMARVMRHADEPFPNRVLGLAPMYSLRHDWYIAMCGNLASHYGFMSFDASNPVIESTEAVQRMRNRLRVDARYPKNYPHEAAEDLDFGYRRVARTLSALGVSWVIIIDPAVAPEGADAAQIARYPEWPMNFTDDVALAVRAGYLPVTAPYGIHGPAVRGIGSPYWKQGAASLWLLYLQEDPIAFIRPSPNRGSDFMELPVKFGGAGVKIDMAKVIGPGIVVINVTAWDQWQITANGQVLPWTKDEYNRIVVTVPPGTKKLEARFRPPWDSGLMAGAAMMFIALAIAGVLSHANNSPARA